MASQQPDDSKTDILISNNLGVIIVIFITVPKWSINTLLSIADVRGHLSVM